MPRFVPAVAGAAGGFIALELPAPMERVELRLKVALHAAVHFVGTVGVGRGVARYGRSR